MSLPPPPAAGSPQEDAAELYDLATPEEIRTRKRRRRWLTALAVLAALLAAGWFGGHPAAHAVKAWQARRIAAKAEVLIDAESWREAQEKVQDACQLRPNEPAVMRAAARFLTRVGQSKDALLFWTQLEEARPLRPDEQLDRAEAELNLGNLDAAESRLRRAHPAGAPDNPAEMLLAMRLALARRLPTETLGFARKLVSHPAATERQRLQGAMALASFGSAEDQASGLGVVRTIAEGGKSPESLEALVTLGRQAGALLAAAAAEPGKTLPPSVMSAADVAARLEAHPLARIQHRLLVLDLQVAQEPSRRDESIRTAINRYRGGEPEELAALCAWLYSKGELAKVLEMLPEAKAVTSSALYLQYLDTLAALGRWGDVEDLIQRQRFTLDPMIEQMYLARCSEKLNQTEGREVHWKSAVAAAGRNVDKLLRVGSYAARNGAAGAAESALRTAIDVDPAARPAYGALLDLYQNQRRTSAMHDLLQTMAARWPDDTAIRNDAAYTGLLLGADPAAAREVASGLVKNSPSSLPHRVTLALAELKLGHALTALATFDGIDVEKAAGQPRQLAVYVAILWEASNEAEARRLLQKIPKDGLLPEERSLLAKVTG